MTPPRGGATPPDSRPMAKPAIVSGAKLAPTSRWDDPPV